MTSTVVGKVLSRLDRVQRSGGGWQARCPAHEDHDPSLTVSEGDDGRVLLNCKAGCETENVLQALDLDWSALFPDRPPEAKREISECYQYLDEDGHLLFEVVRFVPKDFRQRRPIGRGRWSWRTQGVRRVLYRLPALAPAIAEGRMVFVVEGEKDVHALERAGEVATCNPGGAGKWRDDYSALLRGAHVVVVADKDEPGRAHAEQVGRSLAGVAASVRLAEPATGKDVADHLGAGRSVDELVWVEADASGVTPVTGVTSAGQAPELSDTGEQSLSPTPDSRFVPGGAFILDAPATVPILWGAGDEVLWPEGESLLVVGPTGVGKTTLVGQVVYGRLGLADEVLGYPVTPGSRRVLYLACDRPRQIARALRRLATDEHRSALDERLSVWLGPPPRDLAKHPETLMMLAKEAGADTVVIDSLKDVALGLSDDEVGAGLNRAVQTALVEGVEVIGLHHQRKGQAGARPKTLEDVYGSTWITAGAGSVVLLWGVAGDLIVELEHLKQPSAPVGPLKVMHDHATGLTSVVRGVDLFVMLRNAPQGLTATEVARVMFEKDKPTDNERRKAERRLDRLVADGKAQRKGAERGGEGGTSPAKYHAITLREAA